MDQNERKKWYELSGNALAYLVVVLAGVTFYLLLTHLPQVGKVVGDVLKVLSPFIGGFALAYMLYAPTSFMERKVFARVQKPGLRKGLSIAVVYLLALLIIYVLLQMIIPQVMESVSGLANNLQTYMDNLDRLVNSVIVNLHLNDGGDEEGLNNLMNTYDQMVNQVTGFLKDSLPELLDHGRTLGSSIVSGIVSTVTAVIASIYMLGSDNKLLAQLKKFLYALLPTKAAHRLFEVAGRSNKIFTGFINGKLADSAIMGMLCFIFTTLLRIPYAVLVSVVVGVTNIIPFFGPIIGAVPCLMILLMVDPFAALRFGVLIVLLQQFDGNILGPKILGDSTGLSSFWVLVAIVVGGGLFSFPGMILGVPTFAVIYSLVREWAERRLSQRGIDAEGNPLADQPTPTESKD